MGFRPQDTSTLIDLNKEVFAEMGAHLQLGVKSCPRRKCPELNSRASTKISQPDSSRQMKALTPSTQGDVDPVEVRGTPVERYRPPVTLTREDRHSDLGASSRS